MSWEGAPAFRWRKMHKGNCYRVSCQELGATVWTQEATYRLANQWWEKKLAELAGRVVNLPDGRVAYATPTDEAAAADEATRRNFEVVWESVVKEPETTKPILQRLLEPKPIPPELTVATSSKNFLAVLVQTQKPKTYKEVQEVMEMVQGWWADMSVRVVNEPRVAEAFRLFSEQAVSANTKKKRWNIFKRFVGYLGEMNLTELPRNLHSKMFHFKVSARKVPTWEAGVVRSALAGLADKFRLYALLGLNCGMTNVDISDLTKEMVKDGYLTRRRIKTGDHADVPTVSYRLWPETAALLGKFKSDHLELWLVSATGTKLVENRIEDGEVKTKDLIYLNWKRQVKDCPIPLFKFRSVSATLLESHPSFGRYVPHFLGHSPKTLKEKHYAAPSQEVFDQAMDWLRQQLFGNVSNRRRQGAATQVGTEAADG